MNIKYVAGLAGTAVILGTAGTAIAVVNAHRMTHEEGKYDQVNSALEGINSAYGDSSSAVLANKDNIETINKVIKDNFDHLTNAIDTSNNTLVDAFSDDLKSHVSNVTSLLESHKDLTGDAIGAIATELSKLSEKYESVDQRQNNMDALISDVVQRISTSNQDLFETVANLKTYVDGIADQASMTEDDVDGLRIAVSALKEKVLTFDSLKEELNGVKSEMQTTIDYLEDVESKVTGNTYDMDALKTEITGLKNLQSALVTKVTELDTASQDILDKFGSIKQDYVALETSVQLNGDTSLANKTAVAEIKTVVGALAGEQANTKTVVDGLKTQLDSLKVSVDGLLTDNAQLKSDMIYLTSQNNSLYSNMVKLENKINNLPSDFSNVSTITMLTPAALIYDNQTTRYVDVNITDMDKVKSINVFMRFKNTRTDVQQVSSVLNVYPQKDIKLLGSAQVASSKSVIVNMAVTDSDLILSGLWSQNGRGAWKNIQGLKDTEITLEKVQVIY